MGSALKPRRPAEPKPGSTAIGMTADLDQAMAATGHYVIVRDDVLHAYAGGTSLNSNY